MALYNNLVGYFKADEVSGSTTIYDSVSGITAIGYSAYTSTVGKLNNCIQNDIATESRFELPVGTFAFSESQPYSIGMWVKSVGYSTGTPFYNQNLFTNITNNSTYTFGYDLFLSDYNILYGRMYFAAPGSQSIQSFTPSAVMQNTNWNYVVMTYDGLFTQTSIKLYVNSTLQTMSYAGTPTGGTSSINNLFKIGNARTNIRNFKGKLDEIGIWDREISQTEINQLYNSGSGLSYEEITAKPIIEFTGFTTGSGFNDVVNEMYLLQDNTLLVGGWFSTYDGDSVSTLVKLNPDGTLDTGFTANLGSINNFVSDIEVDSNDKILITGGFTAVNGHTTNGVARLNSDGSVDTTFTASNLIETNYYIKAIQCLSNGKYVVGGDKGKFFKLNSNGSSDNTWTNYLNDSNDWVTDIKLQSDESIIATGQFYYKSSNTFKFNTDGIRDTGFVVALSGTRYGYKLHINADDGFYITTHNTRNVYKCIANGDFDTEFNAPAIQNYVTVGLGVYGGTIMVGKSNPDDLYGITKGLNTYFESGNVNDNYYFGLSGLTGTEQHNINSIIFNDNVIYVGGSFTEYNGTTANRIIALVNIPKIPSDLAASNITFNSFDLTWVNNETTYIDNNVIQRYNGIDWISIATVSSATTLYSFTGLTSYTNYPIRVCVDYDSYLYHSDTLNVFISEDLAPTGLTVTNTDIQSFTIEWDNNPIVTGGTIYVHGYTGGSYHTIATLSYTATTYVVDNLMPTYTMPVYLTLDFMSGTYTTSTVTGVTDTLYQTLIQSYENVTLDGFKINWLDNNPSYPASPTLPNIIYIPQILINNAWVEFAFLAGGVETYTFTGLTGFNWKTRVCAQANWDGITPEFEKNCGNTITVGLLDPFCNATNYTLIDSTCGNNDGKIVITDLTYLKLYDIVVTDLDGNTYTFNLINGQSQGLTAGWYSITATPKPAYYFYYGSEPCTLNWIPINDTDTSMSLTSVSIRPVQCQPFDIQYGRIYYNVSGATYAHTYTFSIYTPDKVLYYQLTGITNSNNFVVNNSPAQCYYGVITDETNGCHLLLGYNCVDSKPLFSLGGIKKIWIAKWNDDLEYNYWSTADDDYFLEFDDTSFFTSTKIKEYKSISGGTIQWYSLPVMDKIVKLDQKLEKVRQGFIFTDTLTLAISNANASKWTTFQTLMNPDNKWVYVCIDDNNQAWTGGYRHGGRINTYRFASGGRDEDNGYQFVITAESENKILTAIDNNYIINNII